MPSLFGQLHRDDVARLRQRVAQRDRPEETMVVVGRRPARAVAHRVGDRRVVDRRGRRQTAVDRRGVHVRFERGTGLTARLPSAIELVVERERARAADHRENLAGRGANRDQRALVRADALGLALRDAPIDRGLGRVLHRRIHRRVDLQPALEGRLGSELRFEQMRHVGREVRVTVRLQPGRTFPDQPQAASRAPDLLALAR